MNHLNQNLFFRGRERHASFFPNPERLSIDGALLSRQTLDALSCLDSDFEACYLEVKERDRQVLLINTPELAREVLVHQHRNFHKGPEFSRIKMLTGGGLIVSDGENWKTSRRLVQPGFVRANWDILQDAADLHAEELYQKWYANALARQTVDITADCERFALDVMISALFSEDHAWFANNDGSVFDGLKNGNARNLNVVGSVRQARGLIYSLIERRQETRASRRDMLDLILRGWNKNPQEVTTHQIVDELITLIVAGFETSAILMAWIFHKLGDPKIRAYMRKGDLVENIRCLSQECLRLYPPVWMFSRRATSDVLLGNVSVAKGEVVAMAPYLLHRRRKEWGDPEVFRPQRFTRFDKNDPAFHAYLPFSAGPRRCIGDVLSEYEMQAVMGRIIPEINFEPQGNTQIELEPAINMRSSFNLVSSLCIGKGL